MDKEKLSKMSGEKGNYAPRYELNEIQFNGQKGNFVYREILKGKDENGKYAKKVIGEELNCVFLKHRRSLASFKKVAGKNEIMQSNEHTSKDDIITLFGANEKGIASDLREKYPDLRTRQIIYAYIPQNEEIVRLVIKGASLGSNQKDKEVMGYYDYVSSFAKDEHCFEYLTKLSPVEESNDMGSYYAMKFERGEKLDDKEMENVAKLIEEVHNKVSEIDAYYALKTSELKKIVPIEKVEAEDIPTLEYPESDSDDIEIPF